MNNKLSIIFLVSLLQVQSVYSSDQHGDAKQYTEWDYFDWHFKRLETGQAMIAFGSMAAFLALSLLIYRSSNQTKLLEGQRELQDKIQGLNTEITNLKSEFMELKIQRRNIPALPRKN